MDIFAAIRARDLARVNTLIAERVDVNQKNAEGETPLVVAVFNLPDTEGAPIVRALLAAGANVNNTNKYGNNPLRLTMLRGMPRVAIELLKGGANVHQTRRWNYDPESLFFDAWTSPKRTVMMALLLASGLNIDAEVQPVSNPHPAHKTTFRKLYLRYHGAEELDFLLQFAQANLRNIAPERFPELLARLRGFGETDAETYDVIEEFLKEKREDEIWKLRRHAVSAFEAVRSRRGRRGGRRRATRRRSVRKH